jgi:putative glutathione S-transferase
LDPNNPSVRFVRDLYELSSDTLGKYSVPVLWDTKTKTIVNNESSEIIVMFNSAFNQFAKNPELDLAPTALDQVMKDVDSWIYEGINNGVYKCGFAQSQEAYDDAIENLFKNLDRLEALLGTKKFVTGDTLTFSDVRLFMTLIRFDEVYVVYFKCDRKKISEYSNIMRYLRDLWQIDGFKECTHMDHIKTHYFTSHPKLNFYGIIPAGPNFIKSLEK